MNHISINPLSESYKRIINSFKVDTVTGCWNFGACTNTNLYSLAYYKNKNYKAHRFFYMLFIGSIPSDKLIMHTCDNRWCVNPLHLQLGTHLENMLDRNQKGRQGRMCGDTHALSKITNEQAEVIFLSTEPSKVLAKRFNIGIKSIQGIRRGRNWKSVTVSTGHPNKLKHKWNFTPKTKNLDGGISSCSRCGCTREYVKGKQVYFLNDSVYHRAPNCDWLN